MAETNATRTLESLAHVPIAQLTPYLAATSTRSLEAIVTLTWPYSSATRSVAFLLAEPDFRLRRSRGQVRVQFSGSSAKTISNSGIGSGDKLLLSLDGVEFVNDERTVSTPGRSVEFELRFTERLSLQFQQEGSQEIERISINHPEPGPEIETPPRISTSEPAISPAPHRTHEPSRPEEKLAADEFSSPAFLKRARTSYGSLFEAALDEEDGAIRTKRRKRTRLSSTWTYQSRTPTPEAEDLMAESLHDANPKHNPVETPTMMDEGVQTDDMDDASESFLKVARQSTNIGRVSYDGTDTTVQSGHISHVHIGVETTMLPPINRTGSSDNTIIQRDGVAKNAPLSPLLQPLSSVSLPLVSPLVSPPFGPLESVGSVDNLAHEVPSFQDRVIENIQIMDSEEEKDLYSIIAGTHGVDHAAEYPRSIDPDLEVNGIGASKLDDHNVPEDQYGHWQSVNAQLSTASLPQNTIGLYHDEEPEHNQVENLGDMYSNSGEPNSHQYPDLDDLPPSSLAWSSAFEPVPYPDLPGPDQSINLISIARAQRQSIAVSRSQSAQSGIINLTESSDEGGQSDEEGLELVREKTERLRPRSDHQKDEGSEEDIEEHDDEKEAQDQNSLQSSPRTSENFEDSQDEEEFSEDDVDLQGNKVPLGFYTSANPRSYHSEDEDSYVEEDMDDQECMTTKLHAKPEVIDLLSSDEDEGLGVQQSTIPSTKKPETDLQKPDDSADAENESDFDSDVEGKITSSNADPEDSEKRISAITNSSADMIRTGPDLKKDAVNNIEYNESMDSVFSSQSHTQIQAEASDSVVKDDSGDETGIIQGDHSMHEVHSTASEPRFIAIDGSGSSGHPGQSLHVTNEGNKFSTQAAPTLQSTSDVASQLRNQSNHESPMLARVFSLDGANDEPDQPGKFSRTNLPAWSALSTASATNSQEPFNQPTTGSKNRPNNVLITPDSTQLSQMDVSAGASVDSTLPSVKESHKSITNSSTLLDNYQFEGIPCDLEMAEENLTSFEALEKFNTGKSMMGAREVITNVQEEKSKPETSEIVQQEALEGEVVIDSTLDHVSTPTLLRSEEPEISADSQRLSHHDLRSSSKSADTVTSVRRNSVVPVQASASVRPVTPTKQVTRSASSKKNVRPLSFSVESSSRDVEPEMSTEPTTPTRPVTRSLNTKQNAHLVTVPNAIEPVTPDDTQVDQALPPIAIDEHVKPKGHDASADLALASLDSPQSQYRDSARSLVADLKMNLTRNLRTELGDFTSLKVLRYHLNQKLDILAITTTAPPEPHRAKGGPRQYNITFNVTDPSIAPSGVTEIQIFRAYKDALPTIKAGDGILLRSFQVISIKRGFALRSEEASSWVVFKADQDETRGPPVEYGEIEKNHVEMLKRWYECFDETALAKINRANADKNGGLGVLDRRSTGKAL